MLLQEQDVLQFSPLREKDLKHVVRIVNYYVQYTTVMFDQYPVTKRDMRTRLYHPDAQYGAYTIQRQGGIVGFCAFLPWKAEEAFSKTATISIFLDKEERGMGRGALALDFLEKIALENGITNLIVEVCHENYPAIRLLETNDYFRCGRLSETGRKFDRLLDVVYFRKSLAASM
jgi:phosphinothricin acetyltransferase